LPPGRDVAVLVEDQNRFRRLDVNVLRHVEVTELAAGNAARTDVKFPDTPSFKNFLLVVDVVEKKISAP